jgi:hypothetical protein
LPRQRVGAGSEIAQAAGATERADPAPLYWWDIRNEGAHLAALMQIGLTFRNPARPIFGSRARFAGNVMFFVRGGGRHPAGKVREMAGFSSYPPTQVNLRMETMGLVCKCISEILFEWIFLSVFPRPADE